MIRLCLLLLASATLLQAATPQVAVIAETEAFRSGITDALKAAGVETHSAPAIGAAVPGGCAAVILQRTGFDPLPAEQQRALAEFAAQGGGIVAVNGALAAGDAAFMKPLLGGAWTSASRKFRSRMMLYMRPDGGPVGRDASSFDLDDDTLYDLDVADDVFVIASAFTPKVGNTRDGKRSQRAMEEEAKAGGVRASIYDIQAQVWTWEGAKHRAAVFLQGAPESLNHAAMRALMMRAVAWTARQENVDAWLPKNAADTLRYPEGGPLRPAEAVQRFQMQPGFKAEVVAAEPLIAKPIAVQWDARGRLWVAETPEYPNGRRQPKTAWKDTGTLEPGNEKREARDAISVLEDSNGDGVMDRKSVFCTGIELVCGFCFYKDGLIVLDYPNISWIRDTDGDGRTDKKEVIFGGLPFPNHFILNHLIVSPDGWIYGSSGCSYKPTRPGSSEPVASISPGIFRFRADGSAIQQVGSKGGNSFGIDLTSDLELYQNQATSSNPVQHLVLPEWVLAKAGRTDAPSLNSVNPKRPVFRKDLPDRAPVMQISGVGYYSSACSSLVYEGGAWPEEYDGTVWCTEPILDIIHHERLKPNGPTFTGELLLPDSEWLRSPDYWFCPVDVTVGPDGAMYVLDFYTPVVAHNDTRGPQHGPAGASVRPDREHYFGRIYRIQHEQAKPLTVPDLTNAAPDKLVAAFAHPNRTVRFNAHQRLMESSDAAGAVTALSALLQSRDDKAQVLALWALERLGKLNADQFNAALSSLHATVRKNALLIAEEFRRPLTAAQTQKALDDADARVRLAALRALAAAGVDTETGLVLMSGKFDDPWSSAAVAAALSTNPAAQLSALLNAGGSEAVNAASSLAEGIVERGDTAAVVELLNIAGQSPAAAAAALSVIGTRPPRAPAALPLEKLRTLLSHPDRHLAAAVLPLGAAWDAGELKAERAVIVKELLPAMESGPVSQRLAAVRTLLAARAGDAAILPSVTALLAKPQPQEFLAPLAAALGATGEDAAGRALLAAFPKLNTLARTPVFDALNSRPAWAALLLDALEAKSLTPAVFTPTQLSSLRSHPDTKTAERAKSLLAKLGSGSSPAKGAIIAKLLPDVQQRGNAANGKTLFATCAACHRLGGEGFDLGPPLDGMGAHPVADLLVHIVDPNRSVDDEHRTWNFTMKDGTQYAALIASENEAVVKIRLPGGVTQELKTADIAARKSVPASLMPEGLEALGGESLRDIIAYMQSFGAPAGGSAAEATGDFRPLDLSAAFTADNRQGLYNSQANRDNTFDFLKLGRVTANGVPFDIADPAQTRNGKSLIVLRAERPGTFAATYPAKVEVPVGFAVRRFHFLGGSAGWGGGKGANTPAMKVTLHYNSGAVQEVMLRAGHEFADYIRRIDVPGSLSAEGIARTKNVRTFSIAPDRGDPVQKLVLESPNNRIAATTFAITAEVGDGVPVNEVKKTAAEAPMPSPQPSPPPAPKPPPGPDDPRTTLPTGQKFTEPKPAGTLCVLLVGAGSSHDFPRFFLKQDADTLRTAGGIETAATPNLNEALELLPLADVLVFSGNHPQFANPRFQIALNQFADAGKGIVLLHAAVWRNFPVATGFNKRFAGGGAKGHGHGTFKVTVKKPEHPVLKGVPVEFTITDETYHSELDTGTPVELLAENAPDQGTTKTFPSVWTVNDPKCRIICISLGHAGPAHSNDAYKTLLLNAVKWVASRD